MKRTAIASSTNLINETILVKGWVDKRRDHGKVAFFDVRDVSGKIQVVLVKSTFSESEWEKIESIRPEWIVEIQGEIHQRPEKLRNPEILTGAVEMEASHVTILSPATTPAIPLDIDKLEVNEELRMKYRYLDLRRDSMLQNIRSRHNVTLYIRNWLSKKGFMEVETPILSKSTPEGARDFLVPSRKQQSTFYALPQSPQQYKQLLMVGGLEKYFQIARCFRDEDTRGDRQPEFTQLDIEMSFVEREDVMSLNEELLIQLVEENFPEKKILFKPFPRLTYEEAIDKYGTDRPDLRENPNDPNELAFCWVIDFPFFETNEHGGWTFTHNPFSAAKSADLNKLITKEDIGSIISEQYDIALNGYEIGGGSIRAHRPELLRSVFEIMGYSEEEIQQSVGHMLEALTYGAPPHGGIAWGLDRLLAILCAEPNIREVIAFPKTGDARDPMMESPSEVTIEHLNELGIQVKK
jgi:aspartyl-tRNA synthetase